MPPTLPEKPADLPAAASAEWDRIVGILGPKGVLTPLDRSALAQLCILYANIEWMNRMIEEEDPEERATLICRRNRILKT